MKELREAGVVDHVDALASLARDTAGDVRKLQTSVLDEDNVQVRRFLRLHLLGPRMLDAATGCARSIPCIRAQPSACSLEPP